MKDKTKVQSIYFIFAAIIVAVIASRVDMWLKTPSTTVLHAQEPAQDSSSGQEKPSPEPVTPPTETTSEYDAIKQDIENVFGEYADKAFLLLQGDECAENRTLNPNAVNDNTEWGGTGVDRGVFQINDYWQGIRHEGKAEQFLFDPAINIRIAWRLFEDNGYSFKLWTCGKYYGI